MTAEKIKRLTLDIPENLHTALKVEAAKQGTSMNQLIEGWIREHLPKVPPRSTPKENYRSPPVAIRRKPSRV